MKCSTVVDLNMINNIGYSANRKNTNMAAIGHHSLDTYMYVAATKQG